MANIDITQHGTDWLWAVFAIMIVSAVGLLVMGGLRPVGQRAFFHLSAAICATASIAYFCMVRSLAMPLIA